MATRKTSIKSKPTTLRYNYPREAVEQDHWTLFGDGRGG
jgi:hypothetical protein